MNWYKKAQSMYLGDCRSIDIWDATEMAQMIENGQDISSEDAIKLIKEIPKFYNKRPDDFSFGRNGQILWMYDNLKDVHYFYELV